MTDRSGESLLGGTGQASGGDPVADKEIPPTPPHPTAPKAVAPPDPLGDEDSPLGIPLNPPAKNDGS